MCALISVMPSSFSYTINIIPITDVCPKKFAKCLVKNLGEIFIDIFFNCWNWNPLHYYYKCTAQAVFVPELLKFWKIQFETAKPCFLKYIFSKEVPSIKKDVLYPTIKFNSSGWLNMVPYSSKVLDLRVVNNRTIHNVMQLGSEDGKFYHTRPSNTYLEIQNRITETQTSLSINFGGKLSFILSFFFPKHLHCCYIYFHCSYLYNYYNTCALYAEFQHFILRFNKNSLLCRYHWKRG